MLATFGRIDSPRHNENQKLHLTFLHKYPKIYSFYDRPNLYKYCNIIINSSIERFQDFDLNIARVKNRVGVLDKILKNYN